jgi:hypothetical protein
MKVTDYGIKYGRILEEIRTVDIYTKGLGYLTLDRLTSTLL